MANVDVRVYWNDGNISRYACMTIKDVFEYISTTAEKHKHDAWYLKQGLKIYDVEDIIKFEVVAKRITGTDRWKKVYG